MAYTQYSAKFPTNIVSTSDLLKPAREDVETTLYESITELSPGEGGKLRVVSTDGFSPDGGVIRVANTEIMIYSGIGSDATSPYLTILYRGVPGGGNPTSAPQGAAVEEVVAREYVARLVEEIIAIETELGTNPSGDLASVASFLTQEHSSSGAHGNLTATSINVSGLTTVRDVEFVDQDGTPVANRRLRVTDGFIRATDTSQVEGRYISKASLEQITNAEVDASAAIAYSKLNLTGSIVDADIASSGITTRSKLPAQIAYEDEANVFTQVNQFKDIELDDQDSSPVADRRLRNTDGLIRATNTSQVEGRYISRLSLEQITDSEVSSSAAIAYSKLNLTGSIVDADIASSGITTRGKLPSQIAYEDEANVFTQVNQFKDIELDDQDASPVADRRLRTVDGLIRATDVLQAEGRYISRLSLEQITDAEIANSGITTRSKLPSKLAYEDEANVFTQVNSFAGIELDDQDASPIADRRLRVEDGIIKATDQGNVEGQYISAASIAQGATSGLDADFLDGYDSFDFPRKEEDAYIYGQYKFAPGTLDYIYNYDAGTDTYSANYAKSDSWTIFGDNANTEVNDAVYFGVVSNIWDDLNYNIGTAAVYSATLVWEYWNGVTSTWTAFSPTTTDFKSTGVQSTKWVDTDLTDWAATNVNGKTAYWVRVRISAFTSWTTAPTQVNGPIYSQPAAPFLLDLGAQGQLVSGLYADTVNRQVIAGSGLTGGGALTADVTLNVGAGSMISVDADTVGLQSSSNQYDIIVTDASGVPTYQTFGSFAGSGLVFSSGALQVGQGDGLVVNADDVALDTPGSLTISTINSAAGNHTHEVQTSSNPGPNAQILSSDANGYLQLLRLGLGIAPAYALHVEDSTEQMRLQYSSGNYAGFTVNSTGTLNLNVVGNIELNPQGNTVLPQTNFNVDLGSITNKYLKVYAAELAVDTLVAQDTVATIGGRIIVAPTSKLIADLPIGSTNLDVEHNHFLNGDIVMMQEAGNVEWMQITSEPTAITGGYRYTVTRSIDDTTAKNWYAGDAVVDTGQSGSGMLEMYSFDSVTSPPLDYIYNYDAGANAYSVNYASSANWTIFGDNANTEINDAVYFGFSGSPWEDIFFNIGTAAVYTATLVWEYWNGTAWTSFTPSIATDFKTTGFQSVEWTYTDLSSWASTSVNGQSAYWVRVRISAFTSWTIAPTQVSRKVYRKRRRYGPTIVAWERNSSTYDDVLPIAAFGELAGLYGYGQQTPGVAVGHYAAGKTFLSIDPTNGFRIVNNLSTVVGHWKTNGDILIGTDVGNPANTNLAVFSVAQTYNGESVEAGDLLIGDNSTGKANVLWDKSAGKLNFRGGSTTKLYVDTTGALVAGSGFVTLDDTGLKIKDDASSQSYVSIQWLDTSNQVTFDIGTSIGNTQAKITSFNGLDLYLSALGGGDILLETEVLGKIGLLDTTYIQSNLGVGLVSPNAMLDVYNSTTSMVSFKIDTVSGMTANFIEVKENGTSKLIFDSSSRLGIGKVPSVELDIVGDIRLDNIQTRTLTRSVPTIVDDAVDIGTFTFTQGAGSLWVSIVVPSSSFSVTKKYLIPISYNGTNNAWQIAIPIVDTGSYGGNDFDLDIKIYNATTDLRIRRTNGSTAGTAYVTIWQEGINTDTFTESSATSSVTAPTAYYESTLLTQSNSNVDIYSGLSLVKANPAFTVGPLDASSESNVYVRGGGVTHTLAKADLAGDLNTFLMNSWHVKLGSSDNTTQFRVRDSSLNDALVVLGDRNVGIKKTPSVPLDVSGKIRTDNQLESTIATGTAPLVVASTTAVTNLNADMVDGQHANAFATASHTHDAVDIVSGTFADERIAESNVTQHQAALSIQESQISDGTILARVAANETISGYWTYSNKILINHVAPVIEFRENDQTLPDGLWRIAVDGKVWRLDRNTHNTTWFLTYSTPLQINNDDSIQLRKIRIEN